MKEIEKKLTRMAEHYLLDVAHDEGLAYYFVRERTKFDFSTIKDGSRVDACMGLFIDGQMEAVFRINVAR